MFEGSVWALNILFSNPAYVEHLDLMRQLKRRALLANACLEKMSLGSFQPCKNYTDYADYRLPTTNYLLPTTYYLLLAT